MGCEPRLQYNLAYCTRLVAKPSVTACCIDGSVLRCSRVKSPSYSHDLLADSPNKVIPDDATLAKSVLSMKAEISLALRLRDWKHLQPLVTADRWICDGLLMNMLPRP